LQKICEEAFKTKLNCSGGDQKSTKILFYFVLVAKKNNAMQGAVKQCQKAFC
jgi:hypothetical protein